MPRGLGVASGGVRESECYKLDVFVPQNSYIEILTPKVMVLGGRTFGR